MASAAALKVRRATVRRGLLWLGVIALALLAAWQWRLDRVAAPGVLLALDPARVQRVELQLQRGPVEHYEKRNGQWWCTDGTPRHADAGRLDDLVAIAAAPVVNWRAASDFDAARIGLAPPLAVLRLDGQTLAFGESAVTGPLRYVRVGQRIALVALRYTPRPAMAATRRGN